MTFNRDNGDRGAVAILVAILAVMLAGMAAFAVDFGLAYANKTALQKAADAAALAAAGQIIRSSAATADCATITSNYAAGTPRQSALQVSSDAIAVANNPKSTRVGNILVSCSPDSKRVLIQYTNTGTMNSIFGGLFGVAALSATRSATSDIFASGGGKGLRPVALCITAANSQLVANPGKWQEIDLPSSACPGAAGNYFMLNCPYDSGNNGSTNFATDIAKGCPDDIGIVPQWNTTTTPWTPLDYATQIKPVIVTQCKAAATGANLVPEDCLMANPGSCCDSNTATAWNGLLGQTIALPVFDLSWNTDAEAADKGCLNKGNNVCYPIKAIAAVKVCGYYWGSNTNPNNPQQAFALSASQFGDPCYGLSATVTSNFTGNQQALFLALVNGLQIEGSSGPGGGSVGSSYGVNGTRLVQ